MVEGVRWVIIRQVALALFSIVVAWVSAFVYTKRASIREEAEKKAKKHEFMEIHEVENSIGKGAKQGLSEEVLLAVDGVSGG
jgi:flagellar biosynthesis/type III secretory pathway M-ring protein FliF/YscJ